MGRLGTGNKEYGVGIVLRLREIPEGGKKIEGWKGKVPSLFTVRNDPY